MQLLSYLPVLRHTGVVAASTVPMATPETTPKAPSLNPPRSLLGLKRGSPDLTLIHHLLKNPSLPHLTLNVKRV